MEVVSAEHRRLENASYEALLACASLHAFIQLWRVDGGFDLDWMRETAAHYSAVSWRSTPHPSSPRTRPIDTALCIVGYRKSSNRRRVRQYDDPVRW